MVYLGYLASLGYLAFIIFTFEIIRKKFKIDVEITRKILHILIGFTWVIMDVFWGVSYHQIIMCGLFVVINALSLKFKIFSSIERQGTKNHAGTVYYAIAMLVLAVASFVYPPLYMPFGMAVMCLSFGDGFAPIFSKIFKKHNIKLVNSKTLFGTIGCILFSFVSLIIFNVCYHLDYSILSLIALSFLVGLVELFIGCGLDNFGITFSVSAFALLVSIGLFDNVFFTLTIVSAAYVLLILLSKSLTAPASFLAFVMLLVSSYSAGVVGFVLYVIPFTLIAIVSIIRKKVLNARGEQKESGKRNFIQVAINGGLALAMFIVYKITLSQSFLVLAGVSLSEAFADSLASDIGSLSKCNPFDVLRFKKVQKGLSGGISILGTVSAVLGSVVVGFLCFINNVDWIAFAIISGFGVLGTIIDSILGSSVQALYKCEKCGTVTEKPLHCNKHALLIKGFKSINNNMVNLLSNILTLVLAFVVLFVIHY